MTCDCNKPRGGKSCGMSPAVLSVTNNNCTLFHRVEVPASMGDSKTNPPQNGAYKNVLLYYEADQTSWLYSSDGIPTKLVSGVQDYEAAINLPKINGETLIGDKSSADLKLADAPMVITIASGNTSWSGADTAEDIYNFFLNQGKVNVVFEGSDNYGYGIVSAAYIPGEQKMMCMTTVASVDTGTSPVEFAGNALYGLMTFYTAGKAVDVGELDLQPKLFITDFTGLNMTDGYVLEGVPATSSSIGMVKPGDGLEIDSDGTLVTTAQVFDTVADMKESTSLEAGMTARTLGYHSVNDGGHATYIIVDDNTLVEDGGTIHELTNGLFAVLLINDYVTPEMFGAYGDGEHDDTNAFIKALETNKNVYVPDGNYRIAGNIDITNKSNIRLFGSKQSVIVIDNATYGFRYANCNNIQIEDIEFTAPSQYNDANYNMNLNIINEFANCSGIVVKNTKTYYCVMGYTFYKCNNIKFIDNIMHDTKGWACYFGGTRDMYGDISNCEIVGNTSYNSGYDGIKITGYIENITVHDNICYSNTRDGLDYAGWTVKNIKIYNNNFHNNTLNGIEFKQLMRDEGYPYDDDYVKQFEEVTISDNLIVNNGGHGITSQLPYDDCNIKNIIIKNNDIKMSNIQEQSQLNSGIRIAILNPQAKDAVIIKDNFIDCVNYVNSHGIRLSSTKYVKCINNYIKDPLQYAIYVDNNDVFNTRFGTLSTNNEIIENTLIAEKQGTNCIGTSTATPSANLLMQNNKFKNNPSSYCVQIELLDENTNINIGNEYITELFSETPSMRGTKNVIYKSSSPVTTGCEGWICTNNSPTGVFVKYNEITI